MPPLNKPENGLSQKIENVKLEKQIGLYHDKFVHARYMLSECTNCVEFPNNASVCFFVSLKG